MSINRGMEKEEVVHVYYTYIYTIPYTCTREGIRTYTLYHAYIPEKAVVTHSSTLAWKIPWTEEPGGLQSTGSQRAGQDWVTEHMHTQSLLQAALLHGEGDGTPCSALARKIPWTEEPGRLQSMGSLRVGRD